MAAFSRVTFDAANYLANRPVYPKKMFDMILHRHKAQGGSFRSVIDLGCGPGQVAKELATSFDRIVAVDPSKPMIDIARGELGHFEKLGKKVECYNGSAEKLDFIESGSIDLAIAGQAAHWFKYPQAWEELHRILSPKGTVAFLAYSDHFYVGEEKISKMQYDFTHGKLEKYWEEPGRSIVESLLTKIEFPKTSGWNGAVRLGFDPNPFIHYASHDFAKPNDEDLPLLHKKIPQEGAQKYISTWSAVANYRQAHPEDKDFLDEFFSELWRVRAEEKTKKGEEVTNDIIIGWPSSITMIHKD